MPADPPDEKDTTDPFITVLLPTANSYDANADGFVDVQIEWNDPNGRVEPSTARVRSLRGVNGTAAEDANLLDYWQVGKRDSTGLTFSETITDLLHGGDNALIVSVADTAGNVSTDTIRFALPHAHFLKTIVSGVQTSWYVNRMHVCQDDHRLYATMGAYVLVIDVDSLKLLGTMKRPSGGEFREFVCVPGGTDLYVNTPWPQRFDRRTLQPGAEVSPGFGASGIAMSRRDPNLIYLGESGGSIGLMDRALNQRTATVFPFTPGGTEVNADLAVLPADAKLYATRLLRTGILVINPHTGTELGHIRIGGPSWPDFGVSYDIELSADDQRLYAAVTDGNPRGVVEIDTRTDQVVRTLSLADYVPGMLSLSPSGRRMWVSTSDLWEGGAPSSNVLIDVQTFSVLQLFSRPREPGATRYDASPAFHPNGKYIFAAHDKNVDVYLHRE